MSSSASSESGDNEGCFSGLDEDIQTVIRDRTVETKSSQCKICKIVFNNRGNLKNHLRIHTDTDLKKNFELHELSSNHISLQCNVCFWKTKEPTFLRRHIRREHYNLVAKIPFYQQKKVNQVWFEKVMDTDTVMEIKKTSENSLVMRKLGPNTSIKVTAKHKKIDLSHLYPSHMESKKIKKECDFCHKMIQQTSLKKHIREKHTDTYKHSCNVCKRRFKRLYQYTRHDCKTLRRRRKNKG